MACTESLRVEVYFDGEVDALAAADIERHLEQCAECSAHLEHLEQMRGMFHREATHERAPAALHTRIGQALDAEDGIKKPQRNDRKPSIWRMRPFWIGALGGMGSAAVAATLGFFLLLPLFTHPLIDELVAAHTRSLMPMHLIDVESTDKHTVKPWFAGHADVSPAVADFATQGYRLVGGRADYLNNQRAAVVVYQHGAHLINVFSWAGNQRVLPRNTTRNGYHMAFWSVGNLEYCAVSDTGWDELSGLVKLLQDLSAHDGPQ